MTRKPETVAKLGLTGLQPPLRLQLKRQPPQSLPRGRKDCIRHRRSCGWKRGLTHASRLFFAFQDVHFDRRSFIDPDRIIAIEVRLLHRSILDRDLVFQGGTQSIDDRTLSLCPHRLGIYDLSAINGGNDAIDLKIFTGDRHLCRFRDVASERMIRSDAAALPLGSGFDQPTFSAAKSSTPRKRAGSGSSSSLGFQFAGFTRSPLRNSTGSLPAAAASSSIKHSTAKPLKECSTDRHHNGGTELGTAEYSNRTLRMV